MNLHMDLIIYLFKLMNTIHELFDITLVLISITGSKISWLVVIGRISRYRWASKIRSVVTVCNGRSTSR